KRARRAGPGAGGIAEGDPERTAAAGGPSTASDGGGPPFTFRGKYWSARGGGRGRAHRLHRPEPEPGGAAVAAGRSGAAVRLSAGSDGDRLWERGFAAGGVSALVDGPQAKHQDQGGGSAGNA